MRLQSILQRPQQSSPLLKLVARYQRATWICPSCRSWSGRRGLATSTTTSDGKPYYVTTPIFYVNAAPHVGHMYTMLLADVMKRWQILKGRNALLCTGTDEHGLKIQQAAQKAESDPQAFCDQGAQVFKDLAARINLSNDFFVRTTDKSHKEAVEYAWDQGYIYRSKHEGWYSVSDEAFYAESGVQMVLDPRTGRKLMASKETNSEVQWSSEVNYRFRLSLFRDRLLEFYRANPEWITPAYRMQDVVKAVEEGLEDLSISRPYDRLSWAIHVPTDGTQSIYVWLDALLNYASKVGYPWSPGSMEQSGWPADVHVIGKDIIRFHCIYWPAFLMALNLPLPGRIMTHAHWKMNDMKMSKSIGNGVNPFWAIDRFDVETMRYFLIRNGGIVDDSNYDNSYIVKVFKTDLQDRLGNLVARILQSRIYDPSVVGGVYGAHPEELMRDCEECRLEMPPTVMKTELRSINFDLVEYSNMLRDLPNKVDDLYRQMQPNKALLATMNAIFAANALLQNYEPWKIYKKLKTEWETPGTLGRGTEELLRRRLGCVIFLMTETLRITGIMLQPVMPDKMKTLLDYLDVREDRRMFQDTQLCSDETYRPKQQKGADVRVLFPPLVNID